MTFLSLPQDPTAAMSPTAAAAAPAPAPTAVPNAIQLALSAKEIDSLVIQCCTLHSGDEFKKLGDDVTFCTRAENDPKPGEFAFCYSYLRRMCRSTLPASQRLSTGMSACPSFIFHSCGVCSSHFDVVAVFDRVCIGHAEWRSTRY